MSIILQDQLVLSPKTKKQVEQNTKDIAELKEEIVGVYHFKGSVDTVADLDNITDQKAGDVWNVRETGENYAWVEPEESGEEGYWDNLGSGLVDIGNVYNSLTEEQAIHLDDVRAAAAGTTADGKYDGKDVANNTIFTMENGTFQQYSDTVLPPAVQWSEASKNFIAFTNNSSIEVFAETSDGKIWRSNNASSWTEMPTITRDYPVYSAYLQYFENILYLYEQSSYSSYLYTFDEENEQWLGGYKGDYTSSSFALGRLNGDIVYCRRYSTGIYFSTDCINWEASSGYPTNYEPVKYLNGKFITSDGFTSWKYATSKTSWYSEGFTGGGYIKDFIYDGEKYVALCYDSSLTTTTDFTTFTNISDVGLPTAGDGNNNRIGFSDGVYVALLPYDKIYTTTDLSDWDESSTSITFNAGNLGESSPFGFNGHFFFHTNSENKTYEGIYTAVHKRALIPLSYSKDEVDDLIPEAVPSIINKENRLLSNDGTEMFWMEKDYYQRLNDEQALHLDTALNPTADGKYNGVTVPNNTLFIRDTGDIQNFSFTSEPGGYDTGLTAPDGTDANIWFGNALLVGNAQWSGWGLFRSTDKGLAYNNVYDSKINTFVKSKNVCIGANTSESSACISSNGENWDSYTNADFLSMKYWPKVSSPDVMICYTNRGNTNNYIYSEDDGQTWTNVSYSSIFQGTEYVNKIFYINGKFYMYTADVSDRAKYVYISLDGKTWGSRNTISLGEIRTENYSQLYGCNDKVFFFPTYSNTAYYSTDGINFTTITDNIPNVYFTPTIEFCETTQTFVALYPWSTIYLTSTNGVDWTTSENLPGGTQSLNYAVGGDYILLSTENGWVRLNTRVTNTYSLTTVNEAGSGGSQPEYNKFTESIIF